MATADRRRAGSSLGLPVVLALAAICAVILVAVPTAIAATSAVCDQYPDLPQCQAAGDGTGGGSPSVGGGDDSEAAGSDAGADPVGAIGGGASIPGAGDGATGSASKLGELPFTGYPLTPLVLLLLILLASGIAARAYIAARGRLAIRPPRQSS